jgi:hypothetical protein
VSENESGDVSGQKLNNERHWIPAFAVLTGWKMKNHHE